MIRSPRTSPDLSSARCLARGKVEDGGSTPRSPARDRREIRERRPHPSPLAGPRLPLGEGRAVIKMRQAQLEGKLEGGDPMVSGEVVFLPVRGSNGELVLMVRVDGSVVGRIQQDDSCFRYDRLVTDADPLVHEERDLEVLLRRVAMQP